MEMAKYLRIGMLIGIRNTLDGLRAGDRHDEFNVNYRRYDIPAIADAILAEYGYSEVSEADFWLIAEDCLVWDEPEAVLAANLRAIGLNPDLFLLTGLAAHIYERGPYDGKLAVKLVAEFGSGFLEMACTDRELAEIAKQYRKV
jgi:hypothetical protein